MEAAFGTLIWIVAAVAAVIAIFTLAASGRSYREIGEGGLARAEDDTARSMAGDRDEEIRQLLEARKVRRERRGEGPLDIGGQARALPNQTGIADDDGLRQEIRDHVIARNARRARAGAEPLDVEAEIERQLRVS